MRRSPQRTAKKAVIAEIPNEAPKIMKKKARKVMRHEGRGEQLHYYAGLMFRKEVQRKQLN